MAKPWLEVWNVEAWKSKHWHRTIRKHVLTVHFSLLCPRKKYCVAMDCHLWIAIYQLLSGHITISSTSRFPWLCEPALWTHWCLGEHKPWAFLYLWSFGDVAVRHVFSFCVDFRFVLFSCVHTCTLCLFSENVCNGSDNSKRLAKGLEDRKPNVLGLSSKDKHWCMLGEDALLTTSHWWSPVQAGVLDVG